MRTALSRKSNQLRTDAAFRAADWGTDANEGVQQQQQQRQSRSTRRGIVSNAIASRLKNKTILITGGAGVVGWARPSRLIRGVVLSAKQRGYVVAARSFGVSTTSIMRRHILPQVSSVALTQAVERPSHSKKSRTVFR